MVQVEQQNDDDDEADALLCMRVQCDEISDGLEPEALCIQGVTRYSAFALVDSGSDLHMASGSLQNESCRPSRVRAKVAQRNPIAIVGGRLCP